MSAKKVTLIVLAVCTVIYLFNNLVTPPNPVVLERYHITALHARMLSLTVVVPLIAIWYTAYYGFAQLKDYTRSLGRSKDGRAFNYISNGLGVLAISLPVASAISSTLNYFARDSYRVTVATTIIGNYVTLFFAIAAFVLIYRGSTYLVALTRKVPRQRHVQSVMIMFLVLASAYLALIFTNPERQFPGGPGQQAVYYLPDWLIVATITMPYMYSWYLGFMSALNMWFYHTKVQGSLYKRALMLLTVGIAAIISSYVFVQFITAASSRFDKLLLSPLLAILYLVLIGFAVSYLLVAIGAKRLKKIEEA